MSLPNEINWSFADIALEDAECATSLEVAPAPERLLRALAERFDIALRAGDVRFGREHASRNPVDCRAVVQVHIGIELFNWLFNARSGYRAHFRDNHEEGIAFNNQIVDVVRWHPLITDSTLFSGRDLSDKFEDCGVAQIPGSFIRSSLVPNLSKIWFCGKRMEKSGGITEALPSFSRRRITLADDHSWATIYAESEDAAWIDIKGAFLGADGPYQPKCWIDRHGCGNGPLREPRSNFCGRQRLAAGFDRERVRPLRSYCERLGKIFRRDRRLPIR